MPDPATSARPNIRRLLTDAINAAHAAGLTVTTAAELGVVCASTAKPRWEVDPLNQKLSPLGALLAARQPPIPRADKALTHLLEVGPGWVEGFELGCAGARPHSQSKRLDQLLFSDGFKMGVEFRSLLHRRAGVPVERPADETTDRIPSLAHMHEEAGRRADVAKLLNGLPLSAALELVAEEARTRHAMASDGRIREELELVAEVVTELVGGVRDQGL